MDRSSSHSTNQSPSREASGPPPFQATWLQLAVLVFSSWAAVMAYLLRDHEMGMDIETYQLVMPTANATVLMYFLLRSLSQFIYRLRYSRVCRAFGNTDPLEDAVQVIIAAFVAAPGG